MCSGQGHGGPEAAQLIESAVRAAFAPYKKETCGDHLSRPLELVRTTNRYMATLLRGSSEDFRTRQEDFPGSCINSEGHLCLHVVWTCKDTEQYDYPSWWAPKIDPETASEDALAGECLTLHMTTNGGTLLLKMVR